jgi:hypothetical protein
MATDRQFTNPDYGKGVRVEVIGREVRLIFVASTVEKANDLADSILGQLKKGSVNITLMGQPTSIEEYR